eukprot:3281653-Amphidinium_carterae.1
MQYPCLSKRSRSQSLLNSVANTIDVLSPFEYRELQIILAWGTLGVGVGDARLTLLLWCAGHRRQHSPVKFHELRNALHVHAFCFNPSSTELQFCYH